jgi:hypothetical protein
LGDRYDEERNLWDLVPVDQVDFTGVALPAAPAAGDENKIYNSVHYARANGVGAEWRFVYPGRYDGSRPSQRHQGMVQASFGVGMSSEVDPFAGAAVPEPRVRLGAADAVAHPNQGSFTIQLAAAGWPGQQPIGPSGNAYPFGMFGRLADILQVPFIGAYTVYVQGPRRGPDAPGLPTPELYEMNSVSMDSAFAEDTDVTDDASTGALPDEPREQIGRFFPVRVTAPLPDRPPKPPPDDRPIEVPHVDDFATRHSGGYPNPFQSSETEVRFRYRWAMDLFDHFTIQAPHNDFFPNVAPSLYKYKDAAGNVAYLSPPPVAVSNSGGVAGNSDASDLLSSGKPDESNDYAEDLQPVEGLVNINTAPWKVLAALPMVLDDAGRVDVVRNAELAKAIVYFRDVDSGVRTFNGDTIAQPHGPFRSIFELNEVVETRPDSLLNRTLVTRLRGIRIEPGFQNGYGETKLRFAQGASNPGIESGDLSPDAVRGDFEERYLVLNRISNLITTRSDTFTCYVYVMGVLHDGTPSAELKVQRRVAFIADRSGVRPLRPVVRTQFFNNE